MNVNDAIKDIMSGMPMRPSEGYLSSPPSNSARKDDAGKLRYDLIPIKGLEELAHVYTVGAIKYGDDNWRKGLNHKRLAAAALRHLQAWRKGETRHDDDMHHLASVMWAMMALIEYEETHPECVERDGR
jgi:hypothetical protein